MPEDYYTLLGVDREASEEAILRAYRQRAAEHHPDVSDAPEAEDTFRRLARAKAVLTDPERRRRYDRLGHDRYVEQAGPTGKGSTGDRGTRRPAGGPTDAAGNWATGVSSLAEHLFGDAFATPFDRPSSAESGSHGHGWPRADRRAAIDLTSLLRGTGRDRTAGSRPAHARARDGGSEAGTRTCPRCGGHGSFVHDLDTGRGRRRRLEPCERCGGDGYVPA